MTAFVLVPGAFAGGWLWRDVAARLRAAGADAYAVTPTGLGDRRHLALPDVGLDTHIRDIVEVIDHVDDPGVVLVAHGCAAYAALGAAARRAGRVARVVYVDAGTVPQDGDPAALAVPDQPVRERLLAPPGPGSSSASPDDPAWLLPVPDDWSRWGSTTGLVDADLARLSRFSAPHPVAALTQPLRLAEELTDMPTTGVLCTANGASIDILEGVVRLGDPRLARLAHPDTSFFELDTGHWPMLSRPAELADVLLRAAAGEGRRLTVSGTGSGGEPAPHLRPFVLDVPDTPRERLGRVDLYAPAAEGPRPAVVLVHGGPVPPVAQPTPRDWPAFVGYARLLAASGLVAATVDHRLHDLTGYPAAAEDVADAVALVRADPRVDPDRVALWFFSGGSLLSAEWLAAPPPWLRCVALTYPVLAPMPNWGLSGPRFHPADALADAGALPVVLTRVGREQALIAATVEAFLDRARALRANVEVVDVPNGHHGFETRDDTDESRQALRDAAAAVAAHLGSAA